MSSPAAQVNALADTYRRALHEADQQLAGSEVERKVFQAIIASSAADTSLWVRSRVPNGHVVAEPLENLVPALQAGNPVGKGLDIAKAQAVSRAKDVASSLFLNASWPLWLGSIVAFFAGLFGAAQEAGTRFGAAIIPLLIGGSVSLIVLARAVRASAPVVQALGGAAGSLYERASSVGSIAEQLFQDRVAPALVALYGTGRSVATPVVGQVRGLTRGIVLATYGLILACVAFFVYGFFNAGAAILETNRCRFATGDPTCPGDSPFAPDREFQFED